MAKHLRLKETETYTTVHFLVAAMSLILVMMRMRAAAVEALAAASRQVNVGTKMRSWLLVKTAFYYLHIALQFFNYASMLFSFSIP